MTLWYFLNSAFSSVYPDLWKSQYSLLTWTSNCSVLYSGNWSISHFGQQFSWEYIMPRALFSLENPHQEFWWILLVPSKMELMLFVSESLGSISDSQSPVTMSTHDLLFRGCVYQGLQLMHYNIDKVHFVSLERSGTIEPAKGLREQMVVYQWKKM